MYITKQQSFRILALQLREHHLRKCDGELCNISLGSILEMAEAAGAVFSPRERQEWPSTGKLEATPSAEPESFEDEAQRVFGACGGECGDAPCIAWNKAHSARHSYCRHCGEQILRGELYCAPCDPRE